MTPGRSPALRQRDDAVRDGGRFLAIVRHVVHAHNGEVTVSSVEGQGSSFVISMPRMADVRSHDTTKREFA